VAPGRRVARLLGCLNYSFTTCAEQHNLRRAGVAEGVIMKIGGRKTRSVFERYAIVDQSDIASAVAKLENQQERDREEFGQRMGRDKAEIKDSRTVLPLPVSLAN
jgi:hypothetical protein